MNIVVPHLVFRLRRAGGFGKAFPADEEQWMAPTHIGPEVPEDNRLPGLAMSRPQTFTNGPADAGLNLHRILGALVRSKWLLAGSLVVGTGVGVLASRYVSPQYVAQGTIWIEGDGRRPLNQGPIRAGELVDSYAWVELMKSFTVLDQVVEEQQLFLNVRGGDRRWFSDFRLSQTFRPGSYRFSTLGDSSWVLTTPKGELIERGRRADVVGQRVGFAWRPPAAVFRPERSVEFTVRNPRDIARGLADQLDTDLGGDEGHFLRVSLDGSDPQRLATTLNSVMKRMVEVATQLKRAQLDELTAILDEQRQYAEGNLAEAEMALEQFRVRTITLPSEHNAAISAGTEVVRDPVFNQFFQMKIERDALRRDRLALDTLLNRAVAGTLAIDALTSVSAVQNHPTLAQLLTELNTQKANLRVQQKRYTDQHPSVRILLASIEQLERRTIPAAARELREQIIARERSLDTRIASASSELQEIPPRAIEEGRLAARVQITSSIYAHLRQQYEQARLAAVSSIADVRVLDPATVPFAPVQDLRPLVIAGFASAFFALALLGALLRDRTDRRVRYPEQLTAGMGLPILGAIPGLEPALKKGDRLAGIQLDEAFRELRLALVHAHGAAGPLLLTVSSAQSNDGKTTVASNLAAAFAGQGHRVVLVDGDIRRGDMHRVLGLSRSPGLTDYLAGRNTLDEVIQHVSDRSLAFIGSGTRMHAGPELLGSSAMPELLRKLRAQFAVIVMDSPPLGAGVDAYVLGTATGNMVMVFRTGQTDGEHAEAKLKLLDRLPVRVLGAVLNDLPSSRTFRYYSYLPGYEAEDESANIQLPPPAAAGSAQLTE